MRLKVPHTTFAVALSLTSACMPDPAPGPQADADTRHGGTPATGAPPVRAPGVDYARLPSTEYDRDAAGVGTHVPGSARTEAEYRVLVGTAGDESAQADAHIQALNQAMRSRYADTLDAVSQRLDPVIVVQFDGVGGTFHLRDGQRRAEVNPVPISYELAKSIAHTPLGIYVVLAPYVGTPTSTDWSEDLRQFERHITASLASLDHSSLPPEIREHARMVLSESASFISTSLTARGFSIEAYTAYATRILPSLLELRYFATDTQVRSVVGLLEGWRDELGPERWRELSAVVIAPYTIGSETPNLQCLRHVMDPERVADNLLVVGGDYGKDIDKAISVLGRVFMDRHVARSVFDANTDAGMHDIRSLSSKRDFMADTTQQVLAKLDAERGAK